MPHNPESILPTLRFGLMCSGLTFTTFEAECLQRLLAVPGVELALLIEDARPIEQSSRSDKLKKALRLTNTFWPAYLQVFPLPSRRRHVDLSARFASVPRMQCRVARKGKWTELFSDEDVQAIRRQNLDFILKFAFGIIRGDILEAAKYGVWSFHHDDPEQYRGAPPAFWEIYGGDPVSGAVLQRLTERLDGGVVLQHCFVQTEAASYSQNLENVLAASAVLPSKVARDLQHGNAGYLYAAPVKTNAPIYKAASNRQMLRFASRCGTAWLQRQWQGLFSIENWAVGLVNVPIHRFLDPQFKPEVRWLEYRKPRAFIADPFFASPNELLVEEFDHEQNRGNIAKMALDGNAAPTVETVIDDGFHHSYPFVLESEGTTYCIPECARSGKVTLYARDQRAGSWRPVKVLLEDFAALDPTIIQFDGQWWMFATDLHGPKDANLHLWFAPDLLGTWTPHPQNPVKLDVRSSRPAGTPFVHEGVLYRPAQNCARGYGEALTINRITRLDTKAFAEVEAITLRHPRGSRFEAGFHTLADGGAATVVDGKIHEFDMHMFTRKLLHKILRAARIR